MTPLAFARIYFPALPLRNWRRKDKPMKTFTAEQRREEIIKELQNTGKVRVLDLSHRFGISEVSIRNDLILLESLGRLNRVHGGAVAPNQFYKNMDSGERYKMNINYKKVLAEKVAELVDDNDTIMMNAGTTLTYILRELRLKKNISIVTNSIRNANEINQYPTFNVTLLGGQIDSRYQFTYGNDTIRQLKNYHANKCILSLDGVSSTSGLSLYYTNEALTIHAMMECSDMVIVAADTSKIGKTTFTNIADISEIDVLVTNRAPEKARELGLLKKEGIRVYEAE